MLQVMQVSAAFFLAGLRDSGVLLAGLQGSMRP